MSEQDQPIASSEPSATTTGGLDDPTLKKGDVLKAAGRELVAVLTEEATQFANGIGGRRDELADYIAERADHLALASAEPGFPMVVEAERDNVMGKAAYLAHMQAADFDSATRKQVANGLRIAARVVAVLVAA